MLSVSNYTIECCVFIESRPLHPYFHQDLGAVHVCCTDADHVWAALHEHTTGARVRGHRYAQCTATSWTSSAFSCASTHTHVEHVALRFPMHDGSVRVSTMQACLEFAHTYHDMQNRATAYDCRDILFSIGDPCVAIECSIGDHSVAIECDLGD